MDIDTECTSSETRLSLPGAQEEDKLPGIVLHPAPYTLHTPFCTLLLSSCTGSSPCDSGDTGVTTSAAPEAEAAAPLPPTASEEELGEQEGAVAPSSTGEGEGAGEQEKEEKVVETGAEDCSSSDQVRTIKASWSRP